MVSIGLTTLLDTQRNITRIIVTYLYCCCMLLLVLLYTCICNFFMPLFLKVLLKASRYVEWCCVYAPALGHYQPLLWSIPYQSLDLSLLRCIALSLLALQVFSTRALELGTPKVPGLRHLYAFPGNRHRLLTSRATLIWKPWKFRHSKS